MKLILPLVLGIFILFSSSILNQTNALSCEGPITVPSSFEDAEVVFFGEVISKKYYLVDEEYGFEDSIVKFKLKESFKGFSNETMTVITAEYFFDPTYEEGNNYVVFASGSEEALRPVWCTISIIPEEKNLEQLRLLSIKDTSEQNTKLFSPRQQIANGISPTDVICKEGLELIFKATDESPACVKSETAVKLIERGWGIRTLLPWDPIKGLAESPDTVSLIDNLRAKDATVYPEGEIEQPFFSVTGISIQVNGGSVQVFEYSSAEDAEADASLVSLDGSSIGTSMPLWVDDPHFYYIERIIVLYVGNDPAIEELLESVLGTQFAGR